MLRTLGLIKIVNHKINQNLIGFNDLSINHSNYNNHIHTYSKSKSKPIPIPSSTIDNINLYKLNPFESCCFNKFLSNDDDVDKKVRKIVQEELKKNVTNKRH